MRIAVVEFTGRGGMIHYAFQLCRAMQACGAEVTLITARDFELRGLSHKFQIRTIFKLWNPKPAGTISDSRWPSMSRTFLRSGRAFIYYREWLRLFLCLQRLRPDIVQFGDIRFPADLICFLLLRQKGFTITDICHNVYPFATGGKGKGDLVRRSRMLAWTYRKIYRLFHLVVVHYASNRRLFLASFSLEEANVADIPHGNELLFEEVRDSKKKPEALRKELRIPPESPVILLFGTLNRYKGIDLLMEAFARVRASRPEACLVMAGFPSRSFSSMDCMRLAERLRIREAVRLVTRYVEMEAVAQWMELAAVAVFPYRTIFQSGAFQIALSFGVPVVATRVGSFSEVIRHRDTGLLVRPDDPEALAEAILSLLEDRELAERLSRKASEDARTRFAWGNVADKLLHQYRKLDRQGKTMASLRRPGKEGDSG
ncbi:MAG: glycosyltransferase family 4 protein [bacterium]